MFAEVGLQSKLSPVFFRKIFKKYGIVPLQANGISLVISAEWVILEYYSSYLKENKDLSIVYVEPFLFAVTVTSCLFYVGTILFKLRGKERKLPLNLGGGTSTKATTLPPTDNDDYDVDAGDDCDQEGSAGKEI